MTKQETAQNVADKLMATEHSVDDAMVQAAQLLESMVAARRTLGVSGVVGEVAQSRVAETIAALSEARRSVMAAHVALDKLQRDLGVRTVAVGNDKPAENGTGTSASADTLRVAS